MKFIYEKELNLEIKMSKQITGLNENQVQERIKNNQTNQFYVKTTSSNWEIFSRNVFTPFNALNFIIFVALLAVQAWANLFFFGVIVLNAFSGVAIEIRAREMLKKLNLMNKSQVRVIRDNNQQWINPEDIVLDDIIILRSGDQVPTDSIVIDGSAEVNETMLTGESDLIIKVENSKILSGSYLVSGEIYARVIHVGSENYANKLMIEAKIHKPIQSIILNSMDKIANVTGKLIIPFGLALFFEAYVIKLLPLKDSVITSSTALLGMLPKGIALLTITSLLTAVIKLGMKKVLVQEMYSVETLARVDVLCLDKTGTITQGKMSVENFELLSDKYTQQDAEALLSLYMHYSKDDNATAHAIREKFNNMTLDNTLVDTIPFSSDRKWGALTFSKLGTLFLGAPEMLLDTNPMQVTQAQNRGSRVLVFAQSNNKINQQNNIQKENINIIAMIEISDPIRDGASKTLEYLRTQNVTLKIISGDNPITVSHIAKKAGFDKYQHYLDCSKVTDAELVKHAEQTAIFGRVSPHQKKLLIKTLKSHDHTVAMTGDGVNDILALREADCSIVMAEGDPATKQIANLVLLNSEFNDIPEILFEGRRVINNITHIAPIFLTRTIFSFLLGLLCIASIALGKPEYLLIFPFIQIQITLSGQFVEGFPPFVLTFERNIKPVEKHFLRRSFQLALTPALMIVFSVLILHLLTVYNYLSIDDMLTISYYIVGSIGVLTVIRACIPLTKMRIALICYSTVGFFVTAYFLHNLIEINTLNHITLTIYCILMLIFIPIFFFVSYKQGAFNTTKHSA